MRERRRTERKEERAVYALLQENKQERDLEKAIQAEDNMIQDEEEEDISYEFDESTDDTQKGKKMKSYWIEKKTERDISSGSLDEMAQKRVEVL